MKRFSFIFLITSMLVCSACSPGYKTTRLQNFSGDDKIILDSSRLLYYFSFKTVVLISFYDGKEIKKGPQYLYLVDSLDDKYIYGTLELNDTSYHFSGKERFYVKKRKGDSSVDEAPPYQPTDVIHIYLQKDILKEGEFRIALDEIYLLDTHQPAKTNGGIIAIVAGSVIGVLALGVLLFALTFSLPY